LLVLSCIVFTARVSIAQTTENQEPREQTNTVPYPGQNEITGEVIPSSKPVLNEKTSNEETVPLSDPNGPNLIQGVIIPSSEASLPDTATPPEQGAEVAPEQNVTPQEVSAPAAPVLP
jgi:hypothetical protein